MVTFLVALVGAIVGLVGGFVAGAVAGTFIAAATHMSNFEGASGYFAVFFCGPIGALVGLVLGVWIALRLRGGPKGIFAVAKYSAFTFAAALAGAAAVIYLMLAFDTTLNRNSAPRQALFEIRMPPGTKLAADRRGITIELDTDRNIADAYIGKDQHDDGDRPVISGGVDLAFRTSSRIIVLKMKGEPDRLFQLRLSGNPGHSDAFGPWQPIDWVAELDDKQPRKATPAYQYEIRYRVRDPNVEYSRPMIDFELSLPETTPLPADLKQVQVVAEEAENTMDGSLRADSLERANGRVLMTGIVQMAGERHSLIAITVPNQPTRLFEIKLPPLTWITETIRYATTSPADDNRSYGPSQNVGFIREAGQRDPRPARPEDDATFRYKLQ